ncbi:MAG: hypothetical protein JWL67_1462 [Solirubrobacterales bacterium]|jgi:hypothetical protein|nr:hypothetical protein [Solirubrobacterales bacterium]
MASPVRKPAHFDPTKSLVPGALVVWEAVVMTMPATRFLAITVIGATVLGGCGDHRIVSINGNHRG